jgi:hypothetical protein
MWIESPMLEAGQVDHDLSGMCAASQISSSSWRTTLSTPPRVRPGESSSLAKRDGTLTCTWLCSLMRRKSTCRAVGHRVELDVLGQRADRRFAGTSIITTVFMKCPVESALIRAFPRRGR